MTGKRQNLAVRNCRPGQKIAALADKAALVGIEIELVDERAGREFRLRLEVMHRRAVPASARLDPA
jgi:hypothetical protein